ncbi:MAG: hypothetical protein LBP74_03550 [Treponema sp.]|nr:hypothetical protein [Treponema sp.]
MHFSWVTETAVIQKTMGRIVSHEVHGSDILFNGEEGRLKVRRAPGSLHVIYTCKKEFSGIKTFAVDQSGETLPAPALSEDGDRFTIESGSACLTVAKRTSALSFTDLRNNVILEALPLAWRKDTDAYTVTAAFHMRDNEHFYGLGEKTGFLNKRRYRYRMWNSGQTTYTPGADPLGKSIPLVIAFNGQSAYGLYIDKTCNMYIDLGETDDEKYSVEVNDSELEFYSC